MSETQNEAPQGLCSAAMIPEEHKTLGYKIAQRIERLERDLAYAKTISALYESMDERQKEAFDMILGNTIYLC